MKIKGFIFDLDGTLLDTLTDLTAAVNAALVEYGYPIHTEEEICSYLGNGIAKLIQRAAPPDTAEEQLKKILLAFSFYYHDNCINTTQPYPGILEALRYLHEHGYKIGVLSNKSDLETCMLINHFFTGQVDYIQGKRDDFPAKPDPKSLYYVLEKLALSPKNSVYVGDSDVDVKTAKNGGLPSIGVSWGFRGRSFLTKAGADIIIDDARELIAIGAKGEIIY